MNLKAILRTLGHILIFEALFLILPTIVAIIYKEKTVSSFLITIAICLLIGIPMNLIKSSKRHGFYAREGFVTVAISWIFLSIFGALPFVISGEIPSFTDALYETISGFTTTGSSILSDVEALSKSMLFWRSFTHWIGGMGVLVFIMAILPLAGDFNMHLLRAESPGPQVGKLVPKSRSTAMLLYGIYILLTIVEVIFLLFGNIPLFDALTLTFGTVGTGGFAIYNSSIGGYSPYIRNVITIFMILSGINFNVYYVLLIKKSLNAFKSEELRYYLGIIFVSIAAISINIRGLFDSFGEAIHHAAFQVGSIITTTGYATVDFNTWPEFSKTILWLLMFIGACAGSTGGGIKVSRILILLKSIKREFGILIHPRTVKKIRLDNKPLEVGIRSSVMVYLVTYIAIFVVSILIISLDGYDFTTNVTAVTANLNNIGPGFSLVGATGNFGIFSPLSKYVLMFNMLAGRLEVFPMILLLSHRTWKR